MLKTKTPILLVLILLAPFASPALAYVGPGAGISVLGSLLGILATIFVAIGAILFWPLRKFMQRRKARLKPSVDTETVNTCDEDTNNEDDR